MWCVLCAHKDRVVYRSSINIYNKNTNKFQLTPKTMRIYSINEPTCLCVCVYLFFYLF